MAKITFILRDKTPFEVDAPIGLSVMEIARKAGINQIEGACGGSLACATCHVIVHPQWYDKVLPEGGKSMEEEDMLDLAFDLTKTSRLSCQILMTEALDGLVLALPGTPDPF
jgi:2Fe-2S ferredoxin